MDIHLIADAKKYELTVAFSFTPASHNEAPIGRELIVEIANDRPDIIERCEHLLADRGYDNTEMLTMLWDDYGIKPIVGIRNMWQDGEDTRLLPGQKNIV